ncbi:hypothetical protein ACIF6H_32545 [Streptomyces microflavus]|uniref:hypothetical protein n=1 Tax=Streptomyces microflavus TaxID=1919 RepID=UPI0037D72AE6
MATPSPEEQAGEAFTAAAAEAAQTSVMAFRLMMAIADAVRRQQQKAAGAEKELPPVEKASPEAAEKVKKFLPPDIGTALLDGADWPQLAQQLMALSTAGVDLEALLPRVAEITVTVRDAVAANADRAAREGTEQWENLLRETLPAGPAREAILSSPTWPDMAAAMARLDEKGVDVRGVLTAAHEEGLGVERAVAKGSGTGEAPTTSRDAMLSYGPLTTGLDVPKNLDLENRGRALVQLGIREANARNVRLVREAMPGREREADLLVSARQWPLVSLRMTVMEKRGEPVKDHLARLLQDTSWEEGAGTVGTRLVKAAADTLTRPLGEAPSASRPVVSTTAARSSSPSMGPTKAPAVAGAAPASPGVATHRESGPAPARGKTR